MAGCMLVGQSRAQPFGKFPFDLSFVSTLAVTLHGFCSNVCLPQVQHCCAALLCGAAPLKMLFLSGLQSGKPPIPPTTSRRQVKHTDSFLQPAEGGGSEAMQVQASDLFVQTGDAVCACRGGPTAAG